MPNPKLPLVADDPWLEPYEADINRRHSYYKERLKEIEENYQSPERFASLYAHLGFNYDVKKGRWTYREWAPEAHQLTLVGSFDSWGEGIRMKKGKGGIWHVDIPGGLKFGHQTMVKVRITGKDGSTLNRIPAFINYATQDPQTHDFCGVIWKPEKTFKWTNKLFDATAIKQPMIYEAHVGMAQEKEGIGSYREFADITLHRIKKLGYNTIQLMAIKEHPYYGSFGYHVSNFFAPSSRFGTPDDLKYLINKAHNLGLAVIMDAVYSHAVKNIAEGLNQFDGSDYQYFHEGGKGYHNSWDSKLFNYGKTEVLQFLLSSIKYWIEEFHFDGFRFDGVTSMMYEHHGDYVSFDHYDKYFRQQVDWDAIVFLQFANVLIHKIKPGAITIAEDMSGMPGISRRVDEGGLGFDYRLGMGIPDYWIKTLKHKRDEEWNIHEIWDVLTNRRFKEKTIAYSESHDQALVGDKTLAFWLMDKEMYWHMSVGDDSMIIDRGIALLKMIRLITASLGGEGYMNFIGNEFGHPEWVDFPREGNDWSYQYARRQWSLADNENLKYKFINQFEKDMLEVLRQHRILNSLPAQQLNMDEMNKVIIYERNNVIFLFNFHTSNSIPDYAFKVPQKGAYKAVLISDEKKYGGHNRINPEVVYPSAETKDGRNELKVYLTNRTAMVLQKVD
ncbi:MAG: alpha amylase C-terminal domain-containing protein [Ekhidna sp.]|nr:alpha amylase C-terminal domain-containing protein [Ekhidna sp.]